MCSSINAFLDGLARLRRSRDLPATVMHWGPWAEGGMVTEEADAQLRRRGLKPMEPSVAARGIELALRSGRPSLAITDIDWSRFAPSYAFARPRPLLLGVEEARRALEEAPSTESSGDGSKLHVRLMEVAPEDRSDVALDAVREEIAVVLGMAGAEAIPADRPLQEFGLDSLIAVQAQKRLSALVGEKLSPSLLFDHPTARALSEFVLEFVQPAQDELAQAREALEVLQRIPVERLEREGLMKQLLGLVFHAQGGAVVNGETSPDADGDAESDTGGDAESELFGRLDTQFSKLKDLG